LTPRRRRPLECPNCGADLRLEIIKSPDHCPFCREQVGLTFWYRLGVALLGLFLDLVILGALKLKGLILVVLLPLVLFPATVLAYALLLRLMPPMLKRRNSSLLTLFRR
jgi:hypothetical protein